jgi:hypothetical protein
MVFLSVGPQRGSTKALPIGRAQLVTRKTDEEFYASFGNIVGGVLSPVLANVYLHYVLDLWFENVIKPRCRGEACLLRYADGTPVQA